jgi:CheY-like chemotaxis protein
MLRDTQSDHAARMTVLLVDDSVGYVRLVEEAFKDAGRSITLLVARDGKAALQMLRQQRRYCDRSRPDLILLDLNMPTMNGHEVLGAIKADKDLRSIPTLVLTTSVLDTDILESYRLHANCYLTKPGDMTEFTSLVESIHDFWFWGRVKKMLIKGGEPVPVTVLLVEDSPGDVRLTQEAFRNVSAAISLHVASDGVEAMAFLLQQGAQAQAPRPDLILLDLNLPRMDGREVLAKIKSSEDLKTIPVLILTTSQSEADILMSYQLYANCYMTKPVQLDAFDNLVGSISDFWLTKVRLAKRAEHE